MPLVFDPLQNDAFSKLAAGISNVDVSLSVTATQGARFPAIPAGWWTYATLFDASNNLEIVKLTAKSTDTFTIVRAQDGTTARSYAAGDGIEIRPCNAMLQDLIRYGLGKGANLATATTVTLGTDGNIFHFTGTTQVNGFAAGGPSPVAIIHDGVHVLQYNASTFILPGGINITTEAGDRSLWHEESSGNWRCLVYQRNSGLPLNRGQSGQCQLQFVSATSVKLMPKNGNQQFMSGIPTTIPDAGISAANTGILLNGVAAQNLVASTTYDVYSLLVSGTPTLGFRAQGAHGPQAGTGFEVSNIATTETLVGKVTTNGSAQFTVGNVRSWFNDPTYAVSTGPGSLTTTLNSDQVISGTQVSITTWAGETVEVIAYANDVAQYASAIALVSIGVDGTAVSPPAKSFQASSNGNLALTAPAFVSLAEGAHTVQVLLRSQNAGQSAVVNSAYSLVKLRR